MKIDDSACSITAYAVIDDPPPIVAGGRERDWMEASPERFAYRCLPLTMVNQLGWDILCPVSFTASWTGGRDKRATRITFEAEDSPLVSSHFGGGVLTIAPGYLFRTPPHHNLWVKGPANCPKDGIVPLEGLVETDWAPYTFTINWKITRPNHDIHFEQGEPICRILPYPRHYLTDFEPKIQAIQENAELHQQYAQWCALRDKFNADLDREGSEARRRKWQRDYMRGLDLAGQRHEAHEIKLRIKEFAR